LNFDRREFNQLFIYVYYVEAFIVYHSLINIIQYSNDAYMDLFSIVSFKFFGGQFEGYLFYLFFDN